jgi:hypothetical protein
MGNLKPPSLFDRATGSRLMRVNKARGIDDGA